jgi:hypothetical protein
MEAIDGGTTCVLDFAHMNWTPDHSKCRLTDAVAMLLSYLRIGKQALAGVITSGIRSTFAYAPTVVPNVAPENLLPGWLMLNLELLTRSKFISAHDSRVKMGFGFDFYFMPKDFVLEAFHQVRSMGIRTVTSHWARFPGNVDNNLPSLLDSYGILDNRIILSHVGGATVEDAQIIQKAGAYVSASPSCESTMGLGPPVCFRDDFPGFDSQCSLGVDSHHATCGSMANEMRAALLIARSSNVTKNLAQGTFPDRVCRTAHDAYVMGTIRGARALGMEDQVGSIKVGKKADIAIFDTMSTAMAVAAQHDPITAIVMHSGVSDVDTVIVDGIVRKRNGKLLPAPAVIWVEKEGEFVEAKRAFEWRDVVPHVLDTQRRFVARLPEHDMEGLKAYTRSLYNIP